MVVVDPVGLTIGIGGLLAAFDGAVKGYLLIEEIFSKDNGVRDLALDYNIECEKLKSWGDRFNVKAGKEEDCLLYHERDSIKELMSNIFGRISELQNRERLSWTVTKHPTSLSKTRTSRSSPPVSTSNCNWKAPR